MSGLRCVVNEGGNMDQWIVIAITTKCPKCGTEYEETGEDAQKDMRASWIQCISCGFKGEISG